MKQAIVPASTYKTFKSGEHCLDSVAGDLVLVMHNGIFAKLIRLGQRIKYWMLRVIARKKEYESIFCEINHAMIVTLGGPEAQVSQMQPRDGAIVPLLNYADRYYAIVHTPSATVEQRDACVAQAKWCVGLKYGFFTIMCLIINIFVPVITVAVALGNSLICSTAASLAQRCLGFIPGEPDAALFPADLARYHGVRL